MRKKFKMQKTPKAINDRLYKVEKDKENVAKYQLLKTNLAFKKIKYRQKSVYIQFIEEIIDIKLYSKNSYEYNGLVHLQFQKRLT